MSVVTGTFSDKLKISYLLLVILFCMGVAVYLFDTWGLIKLEEYFPFLKKEAPLVEKSFDSPTLLEREQMKKEEERLEDINLKLQEEKSKLATERDALQKLKNTLAEMRRGLDLEKKKIAESKVDEKRRETLIKNMAGRLTAMRPEDAVAIVEGWSNADVIEVFNEMEKLSVEEGRQSIVPFLITKLPRDRAQIITSLMMDAEASKLPDID